MPETRYIVEYKDGVEVKRTPYEVSDLELEFEEYDKECNDAHTELLQAYRNYRNLTLPQKDRLLKALLRGYLSSQRDFYLHTP